MTEQVSIIIIFTSPLNIPWYVKRIIRGTFSSFVNNFYSHANPAYDMQANNFHRFNMEQV